MSVFNSLKPKANLNREAFDLSRRDIFSSKMSMLVPAFSQDTIPDAVYNCQVLDLIRVDSMQTTPFVRVSQNLEYFFVPYSQIFRDFERLYYERGENQRNVGNVVGVGQSNFVPRFNFGALIDELFIGFCLLLLKDYFWPSMNEKQRNTFIGKLVESSTYKKYFDIHQRLCVEDMLRNLDMLGYGNLLPIFKFFGNGALYNEAPGSSSGSSMEAYLSAMQQYIDNHPRGMDANFVTNINDIVQNMPNVMIKRDKGAELICFNDFSTQYMNTYVSVLRLAAWLKVWSDFYRNSQYDVEQNYAYYFNYDYVVSDSLSVIDVDKVIACLRTRYRQYKKDVFTGSYPTAQFGSVAVAATDNPVVIESTVPMSSATNARVNPSSSSVGKNLLFHATTGNVFNDGSQYWNIDSSVSALSIRQALAFQKYRETILRAGNRTRALQNAVFGDKSRYIEDEYVDFLGAISSNVDINSVAATAESSTQNVAQLSSNGVSTLNQNSFQYHSHDFGVIIGVFYLLSESEYNSYMIDPSVRKTESFDFYKPAFQNLGLDPVLSSDNNIFDTLPISAGAEYYKPSVLGYLAKYYEYKTAVDKVHGEFYNSLPFEVADDFQLDATMISAMKGAFTGYVTPRSPYQFISIDIASLYARPSDIDDIFYASSDEHQSSDQFKINMNHEVKAVLPMSVIGLPQ